MIYDVEAYLLVKPKREMVMHLEEEPLDVPLGVYIVLENQVVLEVGNSNHSCQIARLKSGFEA